MTTRALALIAALALALTTLPAGAAAPKRLIPPVPLCQPNDTACMCAIVGCPRGK